jgi:hypothetical protein
MRSAALENSYYIQDSNADRALESAQTEFTKDHSEIGVVPISCEVVLVELVEI